MKKLVLLVITACMIVTCFACGNKKKDDPRFWIPIYPGKTPWTKLPEYNFKGADFRISNREEYGGLEVVVDDENSEDIVDEALLLRNEKVEDRYNVEIVRQDNSSATHINTVLSDLAAQKGTFDLAMTSAGESSSIITSGAVYDWAKLPYNLLDESHWLGKMNEAFTVQGVIYTAVSKMCVSTVAKTSALAYNRTLGEAWKGKNFTKELIDTVCDGDWTYDELMSIINKYGSRDDSCAFYMTADESIDTWHAVWEIPCIENDAEKGLTDVYMNEKLRSFANRMHTMYYNTDGIRYGTKEEAIGAFMDDKALFTTITMSDTLDVLLGKSGDMVIPQPKYDDNQKEYRSAMYADYSVMSVPNTADSDLVSLIVEALSVASEMHNYPTYKHDALQAMTTADADSMFDIVLERASWDIATLLSSEANMIGLVRNDVLDNLGDSKLEQTYNDMKDEIADILAEVMSAADEKSES